MGKFACSHCKYVFAIKSDKRTPSICPNCGRQGCVDSVPDADAILRDSSFV